MFEPSKLDLETKPYQSHFFDKEDCGSTVRSVKTNNKISKDKKLNHGVYQQTISTISYALN
jgi:hypothetical protein